MEKINAMYFEDPIEPEMAAPDPKDGKGEESSPEGSDHGECCDECKRTCKRNFWTEVLRTVVKISTILLAALGLGSFTSED